MQKQKEKNISYCKKLFRCMQMQQLSEQICDTAIKITVRIIYTNRLDGTSNSMTLVSVFVTTGKFEMIIVISVGFGCPIGALRQQDLNNFIKRLRFMFHLHVVVIDTMYFEFMRIFKVGCILLRKLNYFFPSKSILNSIKSILWKLESPNFERSF